MEVSSGIILYKLCDDGEIRFFVCTPDGPFWQNRFLWSFPKGHIEEGESPFEAATREFKEETSVQLSINISKYDDMGCIRQNKNKQVYIFSKVYEDENLDSCYSNECTSEYPPKSGIYVVHKEIRDYCWLTYNELADSGIRCYLSVYQTIIDRIKLQ